jgi:phosphate uptake regulator
LPLGALHVADNGIGEDVLKALEALLKDPLRAKKAADAKAASEKAAADKAAAAKKAADEKATELDLTGPTLLGGRQPQT